MSVNPFSYVDLGTGLCFTKIGIFIGTGIALGLGFVKLNS